MPLTKSTLRQVPLPVGIAFIVLALMVVGSFALAVYLTQQTERTSRISEYRRSITDVINTARDTELGQRGFIITGKERYLEPYALASTSLEPALRRVANALPDRGSQVVAEMQPILTAQLTELDTTIALVRDGRSAAAIAIVDTDRGKELMDRLRALAERERQWAIGETNTRLKQSRLALQLLVGGLLAGAFAVIILSLMWLRQARGQIAATSIARADAEAALAAFKVEASAREAAEGQVRQMQKMESLGQLTGGIAHDFNNMLAVVLGGIELAKKRLRTDPDRADTMLDNAREGATRAATLTARLLAFSRNQPLAPAPLDLNKLVGGMCDMLGRTLGDNIEVECVYAAGLWRSYADPSEVENAILNLAVNARDAMPGGGQLTVETANAHIDDNYARVRSDVTAGQYVLVCVTDTGTGMPQDVIERAFDPFFTTKEVGKGTGLGLSQVFGFAKQSGGHVAIYSEAGQGTTVKLYLPRFMGADVGQAATVDVTDVPEGRASEVILVVEDEARVRHFAVDALRELGYTAVSAASPAEALAALDAQPEITMLFTDIVMPDMTGRQLADAALERRPGLPVLFTTGYTRNAVVHNGMLDVGVAFLPKPYGIGDLARKVRDVLDGGGINRRI
jgi:signal transduction histidine kinase/CheY-like chemotaxis protein